MKSRINDVIGKFLAVAGAAGLLLASGCDKKEEKKVEPVKQAAPASDVKKEESKPVEAVKKEEPKPAEPVKKEPTAAEKLAAVRATMPAYTGDAGKVETYLADLKEFVAANPGTPEAMQAVVESAVVRTDFLVLAVAGKYPDMASRLMVAEGRIQAGTQPAPEQIAEFYKALSAEFQAAAGNAAEADKSRLAEMAALLFYLSQDTLEAAGKLEGSKLEWPTAPAADAARPAEAKPAEAAAPEAAKAEEAKPAEAAAPEAAKAEEAKPAEAAAPEAAKAEEAKPAEAAAPAPAAPGAAAGPKLTVGGADVGALLALAASNGPIALRARLLIAARLGAAADKTAPTFSARWRDAAAAAGKVACAACGLLPTVPADKVAEVLFLPENAGIVCAKAKADIDGGMPVVEAVRKNCLDELFLGPDDARLLSAENVLVLRLFALASRDCAVGAAKDDPLAAEATAVFDGVRGKLLKAVALEPPIEVFKKEEWDLMKDRLVLQSDLSPAAAEWDYQPLDMVVFDELGVGEAMRPVGDTTGSAAAFADSKAGLRFPGKTIVDVAGIQKEIDEKHAAFKAQNMPFDADLGAYLEEVTIRGVKFMKPHFAIPSVIKALGELAATTAALEPAAFSWLSGQGIVNSERPGKPDYKDTVGRATLLAVDRQAPALLFKRVVDSMYYADGKDDRLLKGAPGLASVPTVYFTEKFVDETVLDTTYKRPVLVYVTEGGQVRFYPPTDITRKGKMKATRSPRKRDVPWKKYAVIEDPRNPDPIWNLFMSYTSAGNSKFEEDVAGIAAQMKSKWDNGNVFYVVADDNALSGTVVKVADILARLPEDPPLAEVGKAYPGYVCDPDKGKDACITNIVVIFPDVEIPYLPGKKKLKEAETNVYCDQKDIAAKIGAKKGAIKFCYDPELQKNPALKGKVVYKFTIDADGKVKEMAVESDGLGNGKVVDCAMNIIRKISFRRPIGGECVVRYPYQFTP